MNSKGSGFFGRSRRLFRVVHSARLGGHSAARFRPLGAHFPPLPNSRRKSPLSGVSVANRIVFCTKRSEFSSLLGRRMSPGFLAGRSAVRERAEGKKSSGCGLLFSSCGCYRTTRSKLKSSITLSPRGTIDCPAANSQLAAPRPPAC